MTKKDRLELDQECLLKYSKAQMISEYIDELDKYKEILDKIKEYIKENANANVDYILELLEEIE
jgi:hypothetical protein